LPSVLGSLRADHYGIIGGSTTQLLCRVLAARRSHLVKASLEALEKVGGPSAIPAVTRLTKKNRAPDVRNLALRVLPVLEARKRDEDAPHVLLRASGAAGADEQVLLR